jgi:hypothetical protein
MDCKSVVWARPPAFSSNAKISIFKAKQVKDTPASTGVSWRLTQASLTANSCINVSGFGSQALIERVEHAARQIARGTLPVSTQTVFAVETVVD